MSEQKAPSAKRRKDRSPNFPFISLEKAIERATAFFDVERRNAAPVPVAVKRWGYAEKSSGGIQTIAALKSYRLMEDSGRGSERKIKLTEVALRILSPKPGSSDREDAIRIAAISPARMAEVFKENQEHPPSDATLLWQLINEKHFTEESAAEFVKIWNKNKDYSRLYSSGIVSTDTESEQEQVIDMQANLADAGCVRDVAVRPQTLIKSEKVIGPEGDILLQFSGEPSIEAYEFLKDYIDLRIKTLGRKREKSQA
jgi:hypothetical protein